MSAVALVLLAAASAGAAAGKTLTMPWSTDAEFCRGSNEDRCGQIGPDGPWQALRIWVGEDAIEMPMWPAAGYRSQVITTLAGSDYDFEDSKTAQIQTAGDTSMDNLNGQDEWLSSMFLNGSAKGIYYFDKAGIEGHHMAHLDEFMNMSMAAVEEWKFHLPDGKSINATVGNLGLGPLPSDENSADKLASGLLEQLKKSEDIGSLSFGLHIGSVALKQKGSLILGGYEQNRALGDIGAFSLDGNFPRSLLVDLSLGVETGSSPLNKTGSIWQGLGGDQDAEETVERTGGRRGTALAIPNAASPYIYLPKGNCEAIAEELPITLDEALGLYLWNTDDPEYERIVNSPAYIGFTFADDEAANITIKVPFKLLNLTLDKPLVDKPTQYFPCQSRDSEFGFWQLGRAFLQAAFLAVDYEEEKMYLAQAPGPDMAQSVTRDWKSGDVPRTNDAGSFAETWKSSWTPIKQEPGSVQDDADEGSSAEESNGASSVSSGAIAGIVIGSAAAIGILAATAWFCLRRRRSNVYQQPEDEGFEAKEIEGVYEMYSPRKTLEAPGQELAHELNSPHVVHEMDGTSIVRHTADVKR